MWKSSVCLAAILTLTACATDAVRPFVEKFSESVDSADKSAKSSFSAIQLDAEYDNLRRQLLAQQGSIYGLDGRCRATEPILADFTAPTKPDCKIGAAVLDPQTDEIVTAQIEFPDDNPVVQAYNARRLMKGLTEYADALSDLTTSKDPVETGAAAASALAALETFRQTRVDPNAPVGPPPKLLKPEGQDLVSKATTEALEAYRYRALKETITKANPSVQDASRIVAIWYYRTHDEARVEGAYRALEDAIDAQLPSDPAGFVAVEKAHEAALKAEASAGWKVFQNIALAHAAMAESFSSGSFEDLSKANTRIAELVETVKAFRAAN